MKKFNIKNLIVAALVLMCLGLPFAFSTKHHSQTTQTQVASATAEEQLSELPAKLYDFLKSQITLVANGTNSSTKFSISSETLDDWGAQRVWAGKTLSAISNDFYNQFEISKVIYALLHDLPYELYWFDKTEGYSNSISGTNSSVEATVKTLFMTFKVTKEYQSNGYDSKNPTVNTVKTAGTANILQNAQQVVETYASLGDYQKLLAYKNKICELVEYDDVAVSPSYTGGYGNPWQVISVFDNNPSTNVVCEGYAKAFQLLCNLSTFENPFVECFTVSGVMYGGTGAGNHMWNVVRMDNEQYYLVDITNSDAGSVGWNGSLFIANKASGSIGAGHVFNASSTISFSYANTSLVLWGSAETSILNITSTEYEINSPKIKLDSNEATYDAQNVTAGLATEENIDFGYEFEDDSLDETNFNWSHKWFLNTNGTIGLELETAPKNAGSYWIQITATSKASSDYKIVVTKNVVINKKEITLTNATCLGRVFNGTTLVSVSAATFDGVFDGDIVNISNSTVANISNSSVGSYLSANLSNITLSGESKNNYTIQQTQQNVALVSAVEITKATLTCSENFDMISSSGSTLESIEIEIVAKGVGNQTISGTFVWVDEDGNEIESGTEIQKDKTYYYKFTPADSNYETFNGSIVLWDTTPKQEEDSNFFKDLMNHELMKYAPYVVGGIVLLIIVIIIAKKRKKSV